MCDTLRGDMTLAAESALRISALHHAIPYVKQRIPSYLVHHNTRHTTTLPRHAHTTPYMSYATRHTQSIPQQATQGCSATGGAVAVRLAQTNCSRTVKGSKRNATGCLSKCHHQISGHETADTTTGENCTILSKRNHQTTPGTKTCRRFPVSIGNTKVVANGTNL